MTALGQKLAAEIAAGGPVSLERFMACALGDPVHGYYHTRDPLGRQGDFTTAPEISQVFGEIIGLWLAEQWQRLGAPAETMLVELGPGRGTLMADLLRALHVAPGCRAAMRVHLVETSPVLRAKQRETLAARHPDITPHWHDDLDSVPVAPMLVIANEFFDALPIRQWRYVAGHWRERLVGLDATGEFAFVDGQPAEPPIAPPDSADGAIWETAEPAARIAAAIGRRLATHAGAALIIDYGHAVSGLGDTLQAMRAHHYAPVLAAPGEADLTAHVDFAALGRALRYAGAETWGPIGQGRFLIENGVTLREQALVKGKDADRATEIRHSVRRLLDPAGMGRLFKVLAATSPGLARPHGF